MALLTVTALTKSFGEQTILNKIGFDIAEKEHVALIGANGCGKSTLMNILAGLHEADSGQAVLQKGAVIGHLRQHAAYDPAKALYDETLAIFAPLMALQEELEELHRRIEAGKEPLEQLIKRQDELTIRLHDEGGLTYKSRCRSALLGMGFSESDLLLPMHALSGGQHAKVQMTKLLLSNASLLLLDEPTNHLDIPSMQWMESYLSSCNTALLVISHDRYFLDRVTQRTLEIEHGRLHSFSGGYSACIQHKKELRAQQEHQFKTAQKEIKRQEEMIARFRQFNREKSIKQAESKEKALKKFKEAAPPLPPPPASFSFSLEPQEQSGQEVLFIKDVTKKYDKILLDKVSLSIRKGERVFLFGGNGTGKSTLFKMITGQLPADTGKIMPGSNVKTGYYDQAQSMHNDKGTVLEEVQNSFPSLSITQARNALANFLFKGDDVFKPLSILSGGERARVQLLKLMLSKSNFLMLDEPTNHLDIPSREAMEDALRNYTGTLFIITHDRYLMNRLATRICYIENSRIKSYEGDYESFIQSRLALDNPVNPEGQVPKENAYQQKKAFAAKRRKQMSELSRTETEITALEDEIAAIERRLSDGEITSDYKTVLELTGQLDTAKKALDNALEHWVQLSAELEADDDLTD